MKSLMHFSMSLERGLASLFVNHAENRFTNETMVISTARYARLYTYDKVSNVVSVQYPIPSYSRSRTMR